MLRALALLNLLAICIAYRHKRYLVYPNGGPARTQFIIGLGIPVDLKEASVTVGTVIKFQYDLPVNSSEYTSRIYGFVNTVSRDMDTGTNDIEVKTPDEEGSRTIGVLENEEEDVNNTLVDITFDERKKRALQFAEGGTFNAIDLTEVNTEVPLEEAIRRQEQIDAEKLNGLDDDDGPPRMNRWDYYKILEKMVERYGYTGRPCLLRTICEAAEVPFTHENGLLAEIAHILFTPSTTKDALSHHTDNEYHAAERLGREAGIDCETLFPECEGSVLETFTQIGEDTLHKFGLM
ncbi:DM4/DM12 family domain-containing protein [Phthorimaea operculella]|nr:DM4/DM12 family domain-containing protein [Phthorimaea operculella]